MQFCFELWISLESQCPYPLYTTVIMLLQWYPEDSWDKNLSLAHSHILTTYLLNVVSHLSFVTKTNWSHYYQILRNSKYFKASELFHTDPHQMYSLVCKITHTILITFSFWIYIKSTWVCTLNHQLLTTTELHRCFMLAKCEILIVADIQHSERQLPFQFLDWTCRKLNCAHMTLKLQIHRKKFCIAAFIVILQIKDAVSFFFFPSKLEHRLTVTSCLRKESCNKPTYHKSANLPCPWKIPAALKFSGTKHNTTPKNPGR